MIKKSGFTLIELLVSIVVMAVVMTIVLGAIANFLQTSRRLNIMRDVQQEMTFALSRMSDKIRGLSIDYNAYDSGACASASIGDGNKATMLCLQNGYRFFEQDGILFVEQRELKSTKVFAQPLFSKKMNLESIVFEVTPEKDPQSPTSWGNETLQRQPLVTIDIKVASVIDPSLAFQIQTSISSRVY